MLESYFCFQCHVDGWEESQTQVAASFSQAPHCNLTGSGHRCIDDGKGCNRTACGDKLSNQRTAPGFELLRTGWKIGAGIELVLRRFIDQTRGTVLRFVVNLFGCDHSICGPVGDGSSAAVSIEIAAFNALLEICEPWHEGQRLAVLGVTNAGTKCACPPLAGGSSGSGVVHAMFGFPGWQGNQTDSLPGKICTLMHNRCPDLICECRQARMFAIEPG